MLFNPLVIRQTLRSPVANSGFRRTFVQNWRRLYSTEKPSSQRSLWTHTAAGAFGGLLVIAGAYSWYHISGLKQKVEAAQNIQKYLEKSKDSLVTKTKLSGNAALAYLRGAAKSYVAIVPGAGSYVDSTFDSLDEVIEAHQEEANTITQRAYNDIRAIALQNGEGDSLQTAIRVLSVFRRYFIELHSLGVKAGGNALAPLWEKYPEAMDSISGALDEMKRVAEQGGPAAKRAFDDAQQQVKNILTKSGSSDAFARAANLVREKTRKLRKDIDSSPKSDDHSS